MDLQERLCNDHTVYVLGAGFSRAAGIPVVREFMNELRDTYDWVRRAGEMRSLEAKGLEAVLAFRLEASAAAFRTEVNVENIEELFSLASATNLQGLSAQVCWAIGATIDRCVQQAGPSLARRKLHARIGPEGVDPTLMLPIAEQSQGYTRYLSDDYSLMLGIMLGRFSVPRLDRRSTIVTFNYDLLVEEALSRLGVDFSYGIEPACRILAPADKFRLSPGAQLNLLKLHGSLNWTRVASPTIFCDYAGVRATKRPPLVIPPTWNKVFGKLFTNVWAGAVQAISTATNIVILGFSAPETDQHFRYLMSAGLRNNISLRAVHVVDIDSGDAFRGRYLRVFRREMLARRELVFHEMPAAGFLFSNSSEIGRGLRAGWSVGDPEHV